MKTLLKLMGIFLLAFIVIKVIVNEMRDHPSPTATTTSATTTTPATTTPARVPIDPEEEAAEQGELEAEKAREVRGESTDPATQATTTKGYEVPLGTDGTKESMIERCRAYVRTHAELPNSVSFDLWSGQFTTDEPDYVSYQIDFTAKNYLNAEIPFTAICVLDRTSGKLEFNAGIRRR